MAIWAALFWLVIGMLIATALRAAWGRVSQPLLNDTAQDALTGLPTRGAGQAVVDALQKGDAVAMIDLDGLKATNDTLGHAAGDNELIALAKHLAAGVRRGDTVTRWGGDEFVVVLRGGGETGVAVIDRLRASSPAGFSAGIAVHGAGAGNDTLAAADAALLAAKRAGGSRVVTA